MGDVLQMTKTASKKVVNMLISHSGETKHESGPRFLVTVLGAQIRTLNQRDFFVFKERKYPFFIT